MPYPVLGIEYYPEIDYTELLRDGPRSMKILKNTLLLLAFVIAFRGSVSASTAFSCSGVADSANSCYTSNLTNFTSQLDLALFPTPDGSLFNGVWTVNSGGINFSASTNLTPNTGGLQTAVNYSDVFEGGIWISRLFSANTQPYGFQGHFDAPPDTSPSSPIPPGTPGDSLIGLAVNGTTSAGILTMSFSDPLESLGFRLASNYNSSFEATISVFSGLNGTGTMIDQLNLSSTAGGICTSLSSGANMPHVPVPCNDAPFLGFLSTGGIHSVTVSTNDSRGFYIGSLFFTPGGGSGGIVTPEPASLVLCGFGMAALAFGRLRRRRSQL